MQIIYVIYTYIYRWVWLHILYSTTYYFSRDATFSPFDFLFSTIFSGLGAEVEGLLLVGPDTLLTTWGGNFVNY